MNHVSPGNPRFVRGFGECSALSRNSGSGIEGTRKTLCIMIPCQKRLSGRHWGSGHIRATEPS